MKLRCRYRFVKINSREVVIRDIGPWSEFMTITNDVEALVEHMYEVHQLFRNQRLFYYDSEDQLDEIIHKQNEFVRFAPGPK